MKIVESIIELDPLMRFAAIIDLNGNILESIMKTGKTSLKTQKEEEHFCKQVAQRRKMRQEFNRSLGKVRYVQVEREKDRKSTRLNSSHSQQSRMPSSA